MKKAEKQMVASVVKLFREGKLNFVYFYNPSYGEFEASKDDHEFIAEYNGLTIRLCRRNLMLDSKGEESFVIPLTKELKQIYKEFYHKHESEIKEVLKNQKFCQKPKIRDSDSGDILKKLQ